MDWQEKLAESKALSTKALEIYSDKEAGGEDKVKAEKMFEDSKVLLAEASKMQELTSMAARYDEIVQTVTTEEDAADAARPTGFKSFGDYLLTIFANTFHNRYDPRLKVWGGDAGEKPVSNKTASTGWASEQKADMQEGIGASGGFLVPDEYIPQLQMLEPEPSIVRQRASIIPMRRRAVRIPVLDQTGGASGTPAWMGGLLGKWTEEGGTKTETEPLFKQVELVAHKLVLYTEATDELLDDSAIPLEAFLGNMYRTAIDWYEERSFLQGTGAGQPLGVINAGATITVARQAQHVFGLVDLINMLENFMGSDPVWMITRQGLSNLMQLNGPAANPSYVFMPSARDGMPGYLFGYPVIFSEHSMGIGTAGDVLLADWSKYLIGDRQAVTIDSSKHYKFQNDITSWRAVHRVGGQPWLSAPITLADGTAQISPFVILGDKST